VPLTADDVAHYRERGYVRVSGIFDAPDPEWEYVNKYLFGAEEVDLGAHTHLPMERGDTLLFHPLLLHGSGHNASAGFRRAISTRCAPRLRAAVGAGADDDPVP